MGGGVDVTTLPADEDYAMGLLTIFSAHALRPGQSLRDSDVSREFVSRNLGRPYDYDAAVAYSEDRGWLRRELGWLRLTGGGFAEM
jgi:hypothetical protein